MSKTTEWVIALEQEKRHLSYMEQCPQPTEEEQLQIDLDNFNHSADKMESAIDNYLDKQNEKPDWLINSDEAYDSYVDNCLSWGEDYR